MVCVTVISTEADFRPAEGNDHRVHRPRNGPTCRPDVVLSGQAVSAERRRAAVRQFQCAPWGATGRRPAVGRVASRHSVHASAEMAGTQFLAARFSACHP